MRIPIGLILLFSTPTVLLADFVRSDTDETLIGSKDRSAIEQIVEFTTGSKYRSFSTAIGKLALKFKIQEGNVERKGVCTATIIDSKYVLTAFHCLVDKDIEENSVEQAVLYMGFLSNQQAPQPFVVNPDPIEFNEKLDFAVLEVEGNPSAAYGQVELTSQQLQKSEELFVIHHPKGWIKSLTRRFCRVRGFATGEILRHDCHTSKGSSGAPIFPDNHSVPRVIAIHTGWKDIMNERLNQGTLISSISSASCIINDILQGTDPKPCEIDPGEPGDVTPSETGPEK